MALRLVIFTVLVFLALSQCAKAQNNNCSRRFDRTLEEGATGRSVVEATVNKIRESGIFGDDHGFLRRMASFETDDGANPELGAGGIWNVTDREDLLQTVYLFIFRGASPLPELEDQIEQNFCFHWSTRVGINDLDVPLFSALAVMLYLNTRQNGGDVIAIPEDVALQATLWKDAFNPDGDTEAFETHVPPCPLRGVDMIFVMDESGSIGRDNFETMKQFAINITDSFVIGPNQTQVGWISFSSSARVVFSLNTHEQKTSLHAAIDAVMYSRGGTSIGAGLRTLFYDGFVESAGYRPNFDVPKVAIVVTDGRSNVNEELTKTMAKLLHDNKTIDMFVVGIGDNVDYTEIETVASAGIATNIYNNIFNITSFNSEELEDLEEILRARTCFDAMFTNHTVSLEMLSSAGLTIPSGAMVHFNIECPPEGLTINACGRSGTTILYISTTTRSPNSADYDEILVLENDKCRNSYIECSSNKRRRQASDRESEDNIYIGIEGAGDNNVYDIEASTGDSSTLQVNLLCEKTVGDDRQSVIISCTSDRTLTETLCSVNNSPFKQCTLPWTVKFTPLTPNYHIRINATDSLNLTESTTIEHQVGPLVLDCSLNEEMAIVCTSSNQLAPNRTVCSFNGNTADPCTLPHGIDVKGLPVGAHSIIVTATDVYGSTSQSSFEYLVVEDRVGDDMVMSVVLDISPRQLGVTTKTLSLCYQVHGEEGRFYNLLSDKCVSVNAHVSQPVVDVDSHVIGALGIHAAGNNGTCFEIVIKRENCAVYVNNQFLPVNTRFEEEGVIVHNDRRIARNPTVVHIAVPNCGRPTVDSMHITCDQYNIRGSSTPTEVLEFKTIRGVSPFQSAHGLLGQFWGRFTVGQSQTATPATRRRELFDMTVFQQTELMKFSGFVHGSWESRRKMCLYSGDRQGFPLIQGTYTDYEMEKKLSTQYMFSEFDEDKCVPQDMGSGLSGVYNQG